MLTDSEKLNFRFGKKVGGIVYDPASWNSDKQEHEVLAILTDARGHNVAEYPSLLEACNAAVRQHGLAVVFIEDGPCMFDLVMIGGN